jgi:O-acetylhomoserine (thiol)-lyase
MSSHFETLCVHGGHAPDPATHASAAPLYRSAAYAFENAGQAADVFALKEPGYIYTRLGNPTQEALEKRMALLEGGAEGRAEALALASGTAAVFYAVINLARQGDNIVSAGNIYGGTYTMFASILPDFGIQARFAEVSDLAGFAAAIDDHTRAIYVEAIGNPALDVADINALAELAHSRGLPLIVDATFATPYLLRPLEHGADIVIHSLTKWVSGQGTGIGGIVIDGGAFDWRDAKFALYNEPDPSYHGIRWGHDLGGALHFITRMRTVPLRNLGACIAPDNAWAFLYGLESLPVRMDRHCANAMRVAQFLADHPGVAWVRYPGLPADPGHAVASRLMRNGYGGMVVFGVRASGGMSGREAGQRFVDCLKLFTHLANVGDAKSLALHPASTTHAQLDEAQQEAAGLKPEMVRLSIGLEHSDDIIADLAQALDTAQG